MDLQVWYGCYLHHDKRVNNNFENRCICERQLVRGICGQDIIAATERNKKMKEPNKNCAENLARSSRFELGNFEPLRTDQSLLMHFLHSHNTVSRNPSIPHFSHILPIVWGTMRPKCRIRRFLYIRTEGSQESFHHSLEVLTTTWLDSNQEPNQSHGGTYQIGEIQAWAWWMAYHFYTKTHTSHISATTVGVGNSRVKPRFHLM